MSDHAKTRPPSAADRWLNCPESAHVVPMYPNDPTAASEKGDIWHEVMDDTITFGGVPPRADLDATEAMEDLLAYVNRRIVEMGGRGNVRVFVEVRLDIPSTGEFGTADIILVSATEIEVIDLKSGFIPVNVFKNAQMITYLTGAINLHGERPKYTVTIFQPNYDHIDGPFRSYTVTTADLIEYEEKVKWSIAHEDLLIAGPWCKKTYCPHRGACAVFHDYTRHDLTLGWNTTEYKSLSDEKLAKALDDSDELAGYRTELRTEAMRRIMNMDRKVPGYKMVKGRKQRTVIDALKLIGSVIDNLGVEWAARMFPDLAWATADLNDALVNHLDAASPVLKNLGTPKHIEDVIKQYAKVHSLPRGGWQGVYNNVVGEYIRETNGGLTLEKAIDGRPAHKRGSEFGPILSNPNQSVQVL